MDSPPSNRLAPPRLPPERELAQRLGVSRATLSHALVALEEIEHVMLVSDVALLREQS